MIINIDEVKKVVTNLRSNNLVCVPTNKLADWLDELIKDKEINNFELFEIEVKNYLRCRDIIFDSKIDSEYSFSYYRELEDISFEHLISNGIFRIANRFNIDVVIRFEDIYNGFIRTLIIDVK